MAEPKINCPRCRTFVLPAADDKCPHCRSELNVRASHDDELRKIGRPHHGGIVDSRDAMLKCSSCEELVEEGSKYCTTCGSGLGETATPASDRKVECGMCGVKNAVTESSCTRCHEPLVLEADDEDDDDSDDDDDKDDDDSDDKDADDKKKELLDRKKKKSRTEGEIYVDLATALQEEGNERGLDRLAAQVVYCEQDEDPEIVNHADTAANPPSWVPKRYQPQWEQATRIGSPATLMGVVKNFKTLVGTIAA